VNASEASTIERVDVDIEVRVHTDRENVLRLDG
jgi:hypothetical protein